MQAYCTEKGWLVCVWVEVDVCVVCVWPGQRGKAWSAWGEENGVDLPGARNRERGFCCLV